MQVIGTDSSDAPRQLLVRILDDVTQAFHGKAVPLQDSLTVLYQASTQYFNYPTHTWTRVALNHDSEVMTYSVYTADGVSSIAYSQPIIVKNRNDPTTLRFRNATEVESPFSIYALGANTQDTATYTTLVVRCIEVLDPDLGVDPVRVKISTNAGGYVTLNQTALDKHGDWVFFTGAQYCSACIGDGTEDPLMIFVTSPPILQELLEGLTFVSTEPNTMNQITIEVSDGVVRNLLE